MRLRKIKDGRQVGKKIPIKTDKQIESASKAMKKVLILYGNPMKNPENVRKAIQTKKIKYGKVPGGNHFKKGNKFGALRKNRKISDEQKIKLSIAKIGKPPIYTPFVKGHKYNILDKNIEEKIVNEYLSGKSGYRISKELKVGQSTISRVLKKNNIKIRPHKISYEKELEIINLYKLGMGTKKISKELNVGGSSISRVLKENKILMRPGLMILNILNKKEVK